MAAKWEYGIHNHKTKKVKGWKNGSPVTYEVIIWKRWYDTKDTKKQYYSVSWQIEGGWSFNGGYGKEIKTNIKTIAAANKVVTATTNKIKKATAPFK